MKNPVKFLINKINERKKKDDYIPLRSVIGNNWKMLSLVGRMSPGFIIGMLINAVVHGIVNSIGSYINFFLFNAFDEPDTTFEKAAFYLVLILVINVVFNFFFICYYDLFIAVVDKKFQHKIHTELFEHATEMDLACFDDPKFYNDYVWAMDESKNRAVQVLNDVRDMIANLIRLGSLIPLLFVIDSLSGFIVIALSLITVVLWRTEDRLYMKKDEKVKPFHRRNSYVNRSYHLADFAKELRIGRVGENMRAMYADGVNEIIKEEIAFNKRMFWLYVGNSMTNSLLQFLPIIIITVQLFKGEAQLGGFVAMINLVWVLRWGIYEFFEKLTAFPKNAQYAEKYISFMNHKPKIVSGSRIAEDFESIELKNVSFSYTPVEDKKNDKKETGETGEKTEESKKYAFKNVSMKISRGEKIAIVGYNGAGKTTLTKLLMRLYDPTEGEIYYNGHDLREYDIPSLRAKIGAVFQDYKIFAATIAENVMGGECTEEMRDNVMQSLEKATFSERLDTLEKGIDTPLTKEFYDDGVNLSGGEAQKVAIARIFARPYELIIMDEPSSALDPAAEYELNHTICNASSDKTMVFISHRLSTTRVADRILMFADGCLIESGSHDELMEKGGKYAEMFRLQAEKYNKQLA